MKKWNVMMLFLLACVMRTQMVIAQDAKEMVVVMSRNYTYEDPRWGQPVELTKGTAIKVLDEGGGDDYYYWPYPAANVVIPRSVAHVPGKVKGERYLVLTGTNVRLREGPSTKYGYYSYNIASSASVYHNQFITDNNQPAKDDWGLDAEWRPYYLPKGTRLPYLGKQGDFYKTKFNDQVFYISAKFCQLK